MKTISLILISFVLSSCAVFHSKKDRKDSKFKKSELEVTGTVEVDVNHRYMYLNGSLDETAQFSPYGWVTPKEVKSFKICQKPPCTGKPERTVLIDLYYGRSYNIMSLVSVLTLGLLPARELEIFTTIAVILDEEKRIVAKYRLDDQVATWFQLFFIFGVPFQDFRKQDKVVKGLVNEVLWKTKKDGVL